MRSDAAEARQASEQSDQTIQQVASATETVSASIQEISSQLQEALVVSQGGALSISDRVYVMDLGRIVHEGPAQELLDDAGKRHQLLGI